MMLSYGLHPQGCRPYRSFVSAGVYPSVNARVNPSVTALCAAPPPLSGWEDQGGRLLRVVSRESVFPSFEAVSLNGLSNDLHFLEAIRIGIVDAGRNGNGLEHGGISTGSQSAFVLQDELRIELTDGEGVASLDADNAPALAELADEKVQSRLVAVCIFQTKNPCCFR